MPRLKLNLYTPEKNWTKVPNVVLDRLMPILKDTELRVLLILIRQTYGWNRPAGAPLIPYTVLMKRTGRKSEAIARAIKDLRKKGLIPSGSKPFKAKAKT